MVQISESGHAKNVANLEDLISYAEGYGTRYNASREALKVLALKAVLQDSKNVVGAVNAALPAYAKAVAAREAAFDPISKLVTRVMNFLKSIASTDHIHENALTYARKIQGRRATAKRTQQQIEADAASGKEVIENSASQMSYDNRLDNFDKLIKLLASIEQYAPNEADLKVESLTALYADLMTKNYAVIAATTPLSNARIGRDAVLYKAETGLVDIAMDAKAYIKAIFGATSAEYSQVSKLTFKKVRQ
jgi:hypothetical protein